MAANLPPVALPPVNNVINLPNQPQDPPVAADIAAARQYKKSVLVAHANHSVDDTVLADALNYELKLLQARDGAAVPAWFHQAMQQQLAPINQRLDNLTTATNRLVRLCSISYNKDVADGSIRAFELVPFLDNSDPTQHPNNLPPLPNLAAVNTLNAQQSRDYYRGYYGQGGQVPAAARRKKLILEAIGCNLV